MGGAIIILFVMFIAGPIGVFVVGVIYSAVHAWLLSAEAEARAHAPVAPESAAG